MKWRAELGVRAEIASNIHEEGTANGEFMFLTEVHTTTGAYFSLLSVATVPACSRLSATATTSHRRRMPKDAIIPMWELIVVDEGGAYDGLYYGTDLGMESQTYTNEEDQGGAGMLLYMPFDVASGNLGADVESVVEAVESAGTTGQLCPGCGLSQPLQSRDHHRVLGAWRRAREDRGLQRRGPAPEQPGGRGVERGYLQDHVGRPLDHNGMQVSSGVYFYRMQAGDFAATHSMTLLK